MITEAASRNSGTERQAGFTLVELLVVIAVIAILTSMLMPGLAAGKQLSKSVKCTSNMKNIHLAYVSYLDDNEGRGFRHRNWARWTKNGGDFSDPGPGKKEDLISPYHPNAYWGVGYVEYLAFNKGVFSCPESLDNGAGDNALWRYDGRRSGGHVYTSYGFNGYQQTTKADILGMPIALFEGVLTQVVNEEWTTDIPARRASELLNPSTTILFQDAWEPMLDGNGDTGIDLSQWGGFEAGVKEYYRHYGDRCNVAWTDGHMTKIGKGAGQWTVAWYLGQPAQGPEL